MSYEPLRRNRRYVPNLAEQQAESARNYVLLLRLLNVMGDREEAVFGLPGQGRLVLTQTSASRYTSFVTLAPLQTDSWLTVPQLDIRAYHDVKLAEIASIDGFRPIKGSHERHERDVQVDEKRQIGRYLGEWLKYCLDAGLADLGQVWR